MPLLIDRNRRLMPGFVEWIQSEIFLDGQHDRSGPLKLDPWQVHIAEAFVDPGLHQVTLMIYSQGGKTLLETALMFYIAAVSKDPAMFVMPSEQMLSRHKQVKMMPFLESCPAAAAAVRLNRNGEIGEDGLRYRGGLIPFTTPQAKGGMKNHPARYVIDDEIDEFVALKDASNPLDLSRQRHQSFREGKMICSSTPGMKGQSLVDLEFGKSDQHRLHTACRNTGELVVWSRHDVRQDGGAGWRLFCPSCGEPIDEDERVESIRAARWLPTNPEGVSGHRGYHLAQLHSLTSSIEETFRDFDEKNVIGFLTQKMAEAYESVDLGHVTEEELAQLHRPAPEGKPWCRVAGVDTQFNRFEMTLADVYGHYFEPCMYVQEHSVLHVREGRSEEDWNRAFREMSVTLGEWKADMTFWDVGFNRGGKFVKEHLDQFLTVPFRRGRLKAIKGVGVKDSERWPSTPPIHGEARYKVNEKPYDHTLVLYTDVLKNDVVPRLKEGLSAAGNPDAPSPSILLGAPERFSEGYYAQLGAEHLERVVAPGGREVLRWRKRASRMRNEGLDCLVYAWAAMLYLGPDFRKGPPKVASGWLEF